MSTHHDDQINSDITEALRACGIPDATIEAGAREAVRELARAGSLDVAPAAKAVAGALALAASAPNHGGAIPQVTFLPPSTDREQADLDAITKAITDATAWSQTSVAEASAALDGLYTEPKAVRR